VEFGGPVGAESPLGRIELLDARDVTFRGTVRTTGDVVQVRGVGTTELRGTSGEAAAVSYRWKRSRCVGWRHRSLRQEAWF
jgi:hypothetical protein